MINQYPTFTVKLYLTNDNCTTLRIIFKKWGNLGKNWKPSYIESVISFSTRLEKVQKLIKLITNDKEVKDIVQAIYIPNTFLFTYDVHKSANIKGDYPDSRNNMDDFKVKVKIAIKFYLVLYNFKVLKRVDVINTYSFRLLEIYLIDKSINSIISTLEKWHWRDNKWIITSPYTKKQLPVSTH